MNAASRRLIRGMEFVLSAIYLVLVILVIPLAFDVGGVACGLAFSFTIFVLYFVLTTVRLLTRKTTYFHWVSAVYYLQHFLLPSLLTFFLSLYGALTPPPQLWGVDMWKLFIANSTAIFTILEGFCSLLLIQAIGQTLNWLTAYKSDSWLIVALVGSGSTIAGALYFLYRIYVYDFTIDIISASLLGSLLTLTAGIGLFGIVSGKGSMIESSLLFAYIVRCIYETFPSLSEDASNALTALFNQTTYNLKNEVPRLPPQLMNTILQVLPFLASNLPGSFKTIWEFLIMAMQKLTLPLLLNLAYRIGVFYAATKIIPSLYHGASYPLVSPPRTPPQPRSRQASTTSISTLQLSPPFEAKVSVDLASKDDDDFDAETKVSTPASQSTDSPPKTQRLPSRKKSFRLNRRNNHPPSAIIRLIYAYSPCIIIAVYTHLMMLYNGELGTELKLWGFWMENPEFEIIVHPWQFWNWVNMGTTLLLYTAELAGNNGHSGGTALTSHWDIE